MAAVLVGRLTVSVVVLGASPLAGVGLHDRVVVLLVGGKENPAVLGVIADGRVWNGLP